MPHPPTPRSRSAGTPGPWLYARSGGKRSKVFFIGNGLHGSVAQTAADNPNGEDDARMIAAAPELFGLLAEADEWLCVAAHDEKTLAEVADLRWRIESVLSKAARAQARKG